MGGCHESPRGGGGQGDTLNAACWPWITRGGGGGEAGCHTQSCMLAIDHRGGGGGGGGGRVTHSMLHASHGSPGDWGKVTHSMLHAGHGSAVLF